MPVEVVGHVEALYRYPVKSMRGQSLDTARFGWHGVAGDRRLAFRRIDDGSAFPWLSASRLPELVRFTPHGSEPVGAQDLPTHVRTPDGAILPVFGGELAADVGRRLGARVEMMALRHGIFDEASVSLIALDTVDEIARLASVPADIRRFRPNVVVRATRRGAFREDAWVGGVLSFGAASDGPALAVTARDLRCSMVNLDPDSAAVAPAILKAIAGANQVFAGVYATVTRVGELKIGDPVLLHTEGVSGADAVR
jgi:uncharacterized protein YcbX